MNTFGFQWHLTDWCNLRCRHCYQDDFSPAGQLPLASLQEMARRILGCLPGVVFSINLTGGEPLLLPELPELTAFLHTFPNLDEMHIITNGTVAVPDRLRALAGHPRLRYFKISLEAGDAATNDAIRGAGNFRTVCRNLDLYRQLTGKEIVLMMTLSRHNLGSIGAMAALARRTGAGGVIYERFVPLGRGMGMEPAVLTAREWSDACREIVETAGLDANPEDLLPFRAFWLHTGSAVEEPLEGALCNLGDEAMALMPSGDIYPCRRLPVRTGNVLQEEFPLILDRLRSYKPENLAPRLQASHCGRCGVDTCLGCRALVLSLTGRLEGDDPQCLLAFPPE